MRERGGYEAAVRTLAMLADPAAPEPPAQAAPFARALVPPGQDADPLRLTLKLLANPASVLEHDEQRRRAA